MRWINAYNKKGWAVFFISLAAAAAAFWFLPEEIPVHFHGGMPDEYAHKGWIFALPFLQGMLLMLGEAEGFKNWSMNGKGFLKTEAQYYWILFGVILLFALVLAGILAAAFL